MLKIVSIFIHLSIIVMLTIVTQIGGFVWLLTLAFGTKYKLKRKFKLLIFIILYVISTFGIVPQLAKMNNRVPLPIHKNGLVVPHNYITILLNRHYVKERLNAELNDIARSFASKYDNVRLVYLDANFPLIDGFPLLPHRSHDDGRKVDLAFMYTKNGIFVNDKPARSGYGYYESPKRGEYNKPKECIAGGFWQYDFPKFLTLGSSNNYEFDEIRTKSLIQIILNKSSTEKVFIEPHLKTRLNLDHPKCRYHGCRAVRHDDHIHYQIK